MAPKLFDRLYERRYITFTQFVLLLLPLFALEALLQLVIYLGAR